MLIIGEKIHILNPVVFSALKEQDTAPIVTLAEKQIRAGADALMINLGPGQQTAKLLPGIIHAISQRVETHFFISADTAEFIKSVKACRGRVTINAATAEPDRLARAMSAAACLGLDLVVLLTGKGDMPHTVDQWCLMAEDVIETAEKNNFPVGKLYLDPVLRTRFDPNADLGTTAMETGPVCHAIQLMRQLREGGIRTIAGLSNISLHLPYGRRSPLHCSVMHLLMAAGLDAVILNPLDSTLMETVRAGCASAVIPCSMESAGRCVNEEKTHRHA